MNKNNKQTKQQRHLTALYYDLERVDFNFARTHAFVHSYSLDKSLLLLLLLLHFDVELISFWHNIGR